jgi:hypothetical protein
MVNDLHSFSREYRGLYNPLNDAASMLACRELSLNAAMGNALVVAALSEVGDKAKSSRTTPQVRELIEELERRHKLGTQ